MSSVIKVENLSKQYRLGLVGASTIKEDAQRWWAKLRGKEDPFLELGAENDRTLIGASKFVWSLKDINFDVQQGDVLGVIGRNGAGKSTLLKILSKVTAPTTGSVKIKGRIASLLEVGTGFHPELTGRENIYLNGAILGMRKHEITRKLDEIIAFAGVEKYVDTPVKRYSSGMYVRLAFAVAAHLENEILIIDEVLAVGDADFQEKCLGKMGEISKGQGRTIMFVSHNIGTVNNLCNKSILLENGLLTMNSNTKMVSEYYINSLNNKEKSLNLKRNINNDIFISNIKSYNSKEEQTTYFGLDDDILIDIECEFNIWVNNSVFGFYITNHRGVKVFTNNNLFWEKNLNSGIKKAVNILRIPKKILVPGEYYFTFVISIHQNRIIDILEDCLKISVLDTGSDFSSYEGYDYGIVYVPCDWKLNMSK